MIGSHAGTILIVTGVITLAFGAVAIAPRWALQRVFGAERVDGLTSLITRHWGLLIAIVGGLLLYAAYHPEVQVPVMVAATIEKLAIGFLIVCSPFRTKPLAALAAIADPVMALLYLAIFAGL